MLQRVRYEVIVVERTPIDSTASIQRLVQTWWLQEPTIRLSRETDMQLNRVRVRNSQDIWTVRGLERLDLHTVRDGTKLSFVIGETKNGRMQMAALLSYTLGRQS